jgi:H+/Cl- antiporter ClcA
MVVAILLGYGISIPSIDARLDAFEATAVGRAIVTSILIAVFLDIVVLWFSALGHAWQRAKERRGPLWPVFLLVVTNFVGAFFYYFFFARRDTSSDVPV